MILLVTMLGKNENGVRNDAVEALKKAGINPNKIICVARDNDSMLSERPDAIEIGKLQIGNYVGETNDDRIIVICNGGTTSQLVPVLIQALCFENTVKTFLEIDRYTKVINHYNGTEVLQ